MSEEQMKYVANLISQDLEKDKEIEDYKSRIDKAIEYINKFWKRKSYYEDVDNCMKYAIMNEWDKSDLLNILQGEGKE